MFFRTIIAIVSLGVAAAPVPAYGQESLDRMQLNRPTPGANVPTNDQRLPRIEPDLGFLSPHPAEPDILVGAIALNGLQALEPADFSQAILPRLGQIADSESLRELTDAIVRQAHLHGFALATARIEAQQLTSGVLTVTVDEGRIDEIRLIGADHPAAREALAPLVTGKPVKTAELERRLLLVGDIDGIQVRNSRYDREQGRGILVVELAEDRASARLALSNEGTRPLGPMQLRLEADVSGVLAKDDSLTFSYTGTPADPGALHFGYLRYAKRITVSGTELALTGSLSRARPGAYLTDLDLRSRSWYFGVNLLQPLSRRRGASLWFEGEFGLRDLDQEQQGILVRGDRLAVARATLYGYAGLAGGRLRSSLTLSRGLALLGATEPGDPFASRTDADGTFTKFQGWVDWTRTLTGPLSLRLAAQGQLASGPLLIIEETSLGGTAFLRGYDWSERTGDEGLMGLAELRYDWRKPLGAIPSAQFFGFVDGGRVTNIDSDFGSGSLASAGGGVRAALGANIEASAEIAVPLSGPRYDTDDDAPKINLRLEKSF